MELISLKDLRGIFPHYFYQRIRVDAPSLFFAEKIPLSYGYVVRRVWIKYPSYVNIDIGEGQIFKVAAPELKLEFLEIASGKTRQPSPLPVSLISSPASNGESYMSTAPSPVDQQGFGMNNSASGSIKYSSILNYLLQYGDQVWIKFTGQNLQSIIEGVEVTPFWNPGFIDIIVEGYMVPENKFDVTKGGNP
jgi:hypothetical protein